MLYVIVGTDKEKGRKALHTLTASLIKRRPDASVVTVTEYTFSEEAFPELLSGQGLFSNRVLVVLDSVVSDEWEGTEKFLESQAKEMEESENIFVVYQSGVHTALARTLAKHAEKIQEYNEKEVRGETQNPFALSDAIANRDKVRAWTLLNTALGEGQKKEALAGSIHFQIRALMRAQKEPSGSSSGLSPFVYQKARKNKDTYTKEELLQLSRSLITHYHEAHRGAYQLDDALEHFILSL